MMAFGVLENLDTEWQFQRQQAAGCGLRAAVSGQRSAKLV